MGGRHSYGIVLGKIESIDEVPAERNVYDHETRAYTKVPYRRVDVVCKTLDKGRKGRTLSTAPGGEVELVVIANQEVGG